MQPVREKSGDAIKFDPFIPPSTAELDALIPACKFVEFIECGGMGAVYKAVQKSLNRTVAVKLLPLAACWCRTALAPIKSRCARRRMRSGRREALRPVMLLLN